MGISMRSGVWQTCYISFYVFQLLELNSKFVFPDGNGFKTSTMRLGVDVIVFSRTTSARYFMLFLLLCWFMPHALFPLNLSWVVRRELYLIEFDYIFFPA
jgi:hypothetical protein